MKGNLCLLAVKMFLHADRAKSRSHFVATTLLSSITISGVMTFGVVLLKNSRTH